MVQTATYHQGSERRRSCRSSADATAGAAPGNAGASGSAAASGTASIAAGAAIAPAGPADPADTVARAAAPSGGPPAANASAPLRQRAQRVIPRPDLPAPP